MPKKNYDPKEDSPAVWANAYTSTRLFKLLDNFERYMRSIDYSESTIKANVDGADSFVTWLMGNKLPKEK